MQEDEYKKVIIESLLFFFFFCSLRSLKKYRAEAWSPTCRSTANIVFLINEYIFSGKLAAVLYSYCSGVEKSYAGR